MSTYYKAVRPNGASFHDPEFQWLPEGWKSGNPIPTDWVVRHPNPGAKIEKGSGAHASQYLSVATVPTDCTGFRWPCVLLEVEAVDQAYLDDEYPNKRRIRAARVIRELPAHEVFGPQGAEVVAILDRAAKLTAVEVKNLVAARDAARSAAEDAAWVAARGAARSAAEDAAWVAARGAAWVAAWVAAWGAARDAAWGAAEDAAEDAAWGAAWGAARDAAWVAARGAARSAAEDAAWGAAAATLARDLIAPEHHDLLIAPWRAVMGDE